MISPVEPVAKPGAAGRAAASGETGCRKPPHRPAGPLPWKFCFPQSHREGAAREDDVCFFEDDIFLPSSSVLTAFFYPEDDEDDEDDGLSLGFKKEGKERIFFVIFTTINGEAL
jgi:hypothetical protein